MYFRILRILGAFSRINLENFYIQVYMYKRESNCLPSSEAKKKTEKIDHFEEVIHPKQQQKHAFQSHM